MQFLSTRGGMSPKSFTDILIGGLASDGGLTVADHYPSVSEAELHEWRRMGYRELAFAVISRFATDIPEQDLRDIVNATYTADAFGSEDITPLTTLEKDLYLLQLSNGPTLAFKDIAMQLLGNLFEYALEQEDADLNILGATSGDTGSAAEYAMLGKSNIRVFMLSPHGTMSPFQQAQMYSLNEPNIFNIAVRGVFDDCQDMVKAVSNDADFKAKHRIGTVNSINWARVTAQVVYYFKAYFAATKNNDEQVSFSVPSGNFGNICAGHIARSMGLPIRHLVLATNENDVLDVFFRTGVYQVLPTNKVHITSSPSMDISKASNFERFIYDLMGRDGPRVKALFDQVASKGRFDLSGTPEFASIPDYGFESGSSTHADRMNTIKMAAESYGRVVDTHTADGIKVALEKCEQGVPMICLETALPAKFEASIEEALGRKPERPAGLEDLESRPQYVELMDANVGAIKQFIEAKA